MNRPSTPAARIAVVTGGGDAPGLNAVLRAVTLAAHRLGWECHGIRDGFNGLLSPQAYHGQGVLRLTPDVVSGIVHLGGTILGTTNRGNPLHFPARAPDGSDTYSDRSDELVALLRQQQFEALIVIGGDSSMEIAHCLAQKGLRVIGVPKTIDNDLDRTFSTFGFDSAVSFATDCIDRLHTTADSHHRVMVVEVMGRYAGWIALHCGIAAGAHAILLPEIPFDVAVVAQAIGAREQAGHQYSIVVVAEGAQLAGQGLELHAAAAGGHAERLGGIGAHLVTLLERHSGKDCRVVVLGHLLRGGSPSAFDRVCASRFGAAAVRALAQGRSGVMVSLAYPSIDLVPLAEVAGRTKQVPVDGDTVLTARDLGICLGDAR
jgi:phosphofructokinase-like protein